MIADNIRTRKLEDNKFKTTNLIVDSKNGVYILPIPVYIILFSSNKKKYWIIFINCDLPEYTIWASLSQLVRPQRT